MLLLKTCQTLSKVLSGVKFSARIVMSGTAQSDNQLEAAVYSGSLWADWESPFVILPDGAPSIIDTSHTALHFVITRNCWPLIGRPAAGCDWSNITGSQEWGNGDTCTHMDIATVAGPVISTVCL